MNIWLIKNKGANYLGNYLHLSGEMEFSDGSKIYSHRAFYRRKDAQKYIKALDYNDHLEVVKFTSKFKTASNGRELQ